MFDTGKNQEVFEGAEFAYHIRWFRTKMQWRSRIVKYLPPEEFTDIQVKGPYNIWEHRHRFSETKEGTLMTDEIFYRVPFSYIGEFVHALIIKKQLMDIFCYRALKIAEWSHKNEKRNS